MVQRKVPAKLDHHQKTESQFQHHDVKNNKGADLKKKMKKSGSIKRPKQLGKPPPPPQSPSGKTATTPNYMKPTTSSDARKEQSQPQASTITHNASPHNSILRRKSSNISRISTSSCKKAAAKTLLARTLTKNPSFKPARASVRKCSTVVLCKNLDAQKATCSSTLKDCKFPAYLSLNPGGTESEGTSTIEVCSYTYCSLNGHHGASLPPLKCFLSARRCMVKALRSFKLGCLSPRRAKPVADGALIEEENRDFFIEIYSKKDGVTAEGGKTEGSDRDSQITDDDIEAEDQEERVLGALSGAPTCDDFETYEALDVNSDVEAMDEANAYLSEQNQEIGVDKEISPPVSAEEEQNQDFLLPNFCEVEDSEGSGVNYDYEYTPTTDVEPDPEEEESGNRIIKDKFVIQLNKKDWYFDEFLADQMSQVSYEESLNSDAFSSSDDGESSDSASHLQSVNTIKSPSPVEEAAPVEDENNMLFESSFNNLSQPSHPKEDSIAVTEDQLSETVGSEQEPHSEGALMKSIFSKVGPENRAKLETDDSALAQFANKSKKPAEESDELGSFNPRGPNFLPLEPGPEAEKVDLKHQDVDERKNAEEWMVDYALRQVVTKLGPARKRKVALLVEAFEKVMPITKCDLNLRHFAAFDQARPVQACS